MISYQEDKPIILREGDHNLSDLTALRNTKKIWKEVDVYKLQLRELFEITNPSLIFSSQFETKKNEYIQKQLDEQKNKFKGTWVYYPWSGNLVHTVNENDYSNLRTNRNKNLITEEEQKILASSCVGIVGLSVGSNVATTLTYGGIAKNLKLAEFDILETTNLNRVRGYLEQIGMNKIDLLSQQLYEINPFLNIYNFPEKINKINLENFVAGNPKPRVIFEIIDSFEMKIHLRALAREHEIPVIMITNLGDRILMDVERYDLDKNIDFFNGRAGKVPKNILEKPDITPQDKHKYAVDLAGVEHIPQKALGSVAEIGKTLVGRPQLASTVTIAGGLSSYLVRKIVLGQPLPSCSWLVDLDKIFIQETAL